MSIGNPGYFKQVKPKLNLVHNENQWTDAADFLLKSGNSYKSVCDWANAGESYYRAGLCFENLNQPDKAAMTVADAGRMFAKLPETLNRAKDSFLFSVRIYRNNSQPINAALLLAEAGQIFQENDDKSKAINMYADAAFIYEDENHHLEAVTQLAIAADICCLQDKFIEASDFYRSAAIIQINNKLTQFTLSEYFMKSVICRMEAKDAVGAEELMNNFVAICPEWKQSKEYEMLAACIAAFSNGDLNAFSNAVTQYDQINKLDKWMANNLLNVKRLFNHDDGI